MNRIYRIVFNRTLGVPQVVSELASAPGRVTVGAVPSVKQLRVRALAVALGLALTTVALPVWAQSCAQTSGTITTSCTGTTNTNGATGSGGSGGSPAASGSGTGGSAGNAGVGGAFGGNGGSANTFPYGTYSGGGGGGGGGGVYGGGGGSGLTGTSFGPGGNGGAGGNPGIVAMGGLSIGTSITVAGGNGGNGNTDTNYGDFGGGGGGGGGAAGVSFGISSGAFANAGTVAGGSGGAGGSAILSGAGGGGGMALSISGTGSHATNTGLLAGGNGGAGASSSFPGAGGSGGAGLSLVGNGNTVTNKGRITGGNGGAAGVSNGYYSSRLTVASGSGGVGAGVAGNSNTLITSSNISGGLDGDGANRADAVDITGSNNTLEVLSGATFNGSIVSTAGNGNTLDLDGSVDGSFDTSNLTGGFDAYLKQNTSTWTLVNTTTAVTPWTINAGTLAISDDAALGDSSGTLTLNGGVLETTADLTSSRNVALGASGGSINADANTTATFAGVIGDAVAGTRGSVTSNGAGTLVLTAAETYTGQTTIAAGTLALSGTGSIANSSDVIDNGTLDISATSNGALITSLGGSTGSINLGSQTLTLTNANDAFAGAISGSGGLVLSGGQETLNGVNTYSGNTAVQGGTLVVGDSSHTGALVAGDVSVASGAVLGGFGSVSGNVSVASGGYLAPGSGNTIGAFTIGGNLTLDQGSELNFAFGAPGANATTAGTGDIVSVGGNLALNGAVFNVSDAGGFGPGLYNLFSYSGSLTQTNGGITLGSAPSGDTLAIQTFRGARQINLLNTIGVTLNIWNGNGLASPNQMGGGSGIWSVTAPNWTDMNGDVTASMQPQPGFAIFGGAAGTVTVDNSAGAVTATGMQFASSGYVLTGDTLTLVADANGQEPTIRVGNGSTDGASDVATVANVLAGTAGLNKSDYGTLVLTGNNTYTGGTTITAGTLQLGGGGRTGSILGDVVNNGTLAFDRSDAVTFGNTVSGNAPNLSPSPSAAQLVGGIRMRLDSWRSRITAARLDATTCARDDIECGDERVHARLHA